MKKIRLVFAALVLALAGTTSAYAGSSVGFSVNLGFPGYYAAPPPVYYAAPPVVYYRPAPVYYYGPSVYYRPYYEPRRYYYDHGNHGGWNHGGNNHGWDDHHGGHH